VHLGMIALYETCPGHSFALNYRSASQAISHNVPDAYTVNETCILEWLSPKKMYFMWFSFSRTLFHSFNLLFLFCYFSR